MTGCFRSGYFGMFIVACSSSSCCCCSAPAPSPTIPIPAYYKLFPPHPCQQFRPHADRTTHSVNKGLIYITFGTQTHPRCPRCEDTPPSKAKLNHPALKLGTTHTPLRARGPTTHHSRRVPQYMKHCRTHDHTTVHLHPPFIYHPPHAPYKLYNSA